MGKGSFNSETKQDIIINIDLKVIADNLAKDPAFIAAITKQVRDQMTKDVRWMGNIFAKWASTNPPAPTTKKRVN